MELLKYGPYQELSLITYENGYLYLLRIMSLIPSEKSKNYN